MPELMKKILRPWRDFLTDMVADAAEDHIEERPRRVVIEFSDGKITLEGVLKVDFPDEH